MRITRRQKLRNLIGWWEVGDLFEINGRWYRITGIDHCYGWHPYEPYVDPADEALAEGAKLLAELKRDG